MDDYRIWQKEKLRDELCELIGRIGRRAPGRPDDEVGALELAQAALAAVERALAELKTQGHP